MKKKTVTEMVCILDKSGSMYGKEMDTIGSYNQMLKEQQEKEGEAYITTALFSDQCKVLYNHTPIRQAERLTEQEYYVGGNTALFDAIGQVLTQVEEVLKKEETAYEEKVLVFIITDGMENASIEYRQSTIRKMIEEREKKGWVILFFGTDMETLNLAQDIGVTKENARQYSMNSSGIRENYQFASERFTEMRR